MVDGRLTVSDANLESWVRQLGRKGTLWDVIKYRRFTRFPEETRSICQTNKVLNAPISEANDVAQPTLAPYRNLSRQLRLGK